MLTPPPAWRPLKHHPNAGDSILLATIVGAENPDAMRESPHVVHVSRPVFRVSLSIDGGPESRLHDMRLELHRAPKLRLPTPVQLYLPRPSSIETPAESCSEGTPAARHRRSSSVVPLMPRSASEATPEKCQRAASWKSQMRLQGLPTDLAVDLYTDTDQADQTTKFSGRLPMLRPSTGSFTSELLTD
jgi:hypothetical protein